MVIANSPHTARLAEQQVGPPELQQHAQFVSKGPAAGDRALIVKVEYRHCIGAHARTGGRNAAERPGVCAVDVEAHPHLIALGQQHIQPVTPLGKRRVEIEFTVAMRWNPKRRL